MKNNNLLYLFQRRQSRVVIRLGSNLGNKFLINHLTSSIDSKHEHRNTDNVITLSIPSVVQKRPCAKGKSLETANTTVSGCEAASLLKRLTEAAHTLVSKLGKTFITTFFPFKSLNDNSDKSLFTPLKSGASVPTFGNSPFV